MIGVVSLPKQVTHIDYTKFYYTNSTCLGGRSATTRDSKFLKIKGSS